MIPSPHRRIGWLVAAIAVLLLPSGPAAAQKSSVPFGEGSHALRLLMHMHRPQLTPITSEEELLQEMRDHPERILIISLGKQAWLTTQNINLASFHQRGGAFLGATDQASREWMNAYEWRVRGEFLSGADGYRGSPDCPFVVPYDDQNCPVFRGYKKVATNRPSYLEHPFREAPPVPRIARLDKVVPGDDAEREPSSYYFAAGGPLHSGRVLLLADHSVFINDMMLPTDNGNFDFARSAIDWLTENGQRNRVFFMEDGVLVTNFNVPVKEGAAPPAPTLSQMLGMAYKLWTGLEKEDFFRRQLNQANRQLPELDRQLGKAVPRTGLLRLLAIGLTVGLGFFALARLVRSRHQSEAQVPLLGPVLDTVRSSEAVMDRRRSAVLQGGNFWEAAHAAAWQFFDAAGQKAGLPELSGGDRHQRRARQRQVRRLWQVARASQPWRISAREFERIAADIDGLRAALADGTLRWGATASGAQGAA